MKIEFFSQYADLIDKPVPLSKATPDWFKKFETHMNNDLNDPTVKKCVPFLDAMTCGYVIKLPFDIMFTKKINENTGVKEINIQAGNIFNDAKGAYPEANIGAVGHYKFQVPGNMLHPNEIPIPFKFLNPWTIKTPQGYSCLFTGPFNREKTDVRLVTGIVDTDEYSQPVNFTFYLQDWDETLNPNKIISKGFLVANVFPFKRDNWKMKVTQKKPFSDKKIERFKYDYFSYLKDAYKKLIWKKKIYK